MRSPTDPDRHFEIVASDSPVTVDGYALGEPARIECAVEDCDASVPLTPEPSPGVGALDHAADCPQADVRWPRD